MYCGASDLIRNLRARMRFVRQVYYAPGALSDDAVWRLSVSYIEVENRKA